MGPRSGFMVLGCLGEACVCGSGQDGHLCPTTGVSTRRVKANSAGHLSDPQPCTDLLRNSKGHPPAFWTSSGSKATSTSICNITDDELIGDQMPFCG